MNKKDINYKYKKLCPFKWFVLENFPFIEADFDALTNWQLFCKLGLEMNKIITSVNLSGEQVEKLTEAFNNLQNYVNNYFDNLDVQEEINNKLDEMSQDGTLQEILIHYINLKSVLAFNNINELKNADNLADGSFAVTYGFDTLNDGNSNFYKIRKLTSSDVINNDNIIKLNFSDTLIAEKIINNKKKKMLVFGDSWTISNYPYVTEQKYTWYNRLAKLLNCEVTTYGVSGAGYTIANNNILSQINKAVNEITNKEDISYIFVMGGYNDLNFSSNVDGFVNSVTEVFNTLNLNFPFAKKYCCGINTPYKLLKSETNTQTWKTNSYFYNQMLISSCIATHTLFINMLPFLLGANNNLNETLHPNDDGMNLLAYSIYNSIKGTYTKQTLDQINPTYTLEPLDGNNPSLVNKKVFNFTDHIEIGFTLTLDSQLTSDAVYNWYADELPLNYMLGHAETSSDGKYPLNIYYMIYNNRNLIQIHLPAGAKGHYDIKLSVPLV